MNTILRLFAALAITVFAFGTNASLITIDLNGGWHSYDGLDADKNIIIQLNLNTSTGMPNGAPIEIDGIGWDLNIETFLSSWLSEAAIEFENGELVLTPGAGFDQPGNQFFSSGGIVYLADIGLPNITLSNGILTLQFFEHFDDGALLADAILNGTLTISTVMAPVPVPAALWLFASGLFATGMIAQRRKSVA